MSGFFYTLGVIVYSIFFAEAFSWVVYNKRVCRMRVVLKATLLAGAALNPLYLSSMAMMVDLILLIVEYRLRKRQLINATIWLLSNIFIYLALIFFYFIPDSFLTWSGDSLCDTDSVL